MHVWSEVNPVYHIRVCDSEPATVRRPHDPRTWHVSAIHVHPDHFVLICHAQWGPFRWHKKLTGYDNIFGPQLPAILQQAIVSLRSRFFKEQFDFEQSLTEKARQLAGELPIREDYYPFGMGEPHNPGPGGWYKHPVTGEPVF